MFFWVNRKCLIPVNTGSDWPFSVKCSGLQRNHDAFLALGLDKKCLGLPPYTVFDWLFFPTFCARSVIKRLI